MIRVDGGRLSIRILLCSTDHPASYCTRPVSFGLSSKTSWPMVLCDWLFHNLGPLRFCLQLSFRLVG